MADYKQRSQEYAQKLKDPRWQKKRLKILERDEWTCQRCYDNESSLAVHHRIYIQEKEPWDYPDELLITLCENCHEEERILMAEIESDIINILKSKFLANDIQDIATGFLLMELPQVHEVSASIIRWILSDQDLLMELSDRYFEHLRETAHKREEIVNA